MQEIIHQLEEKRAAARMGGAKKGFQPSTQRAS